MRNALRNRLARLERRHAAPLSLEPSGGIGLSALLALSPEPKHDPALEATHEEAVFMRLHYAEIAAACQPSRERGLAGLLDAYRLQLEVCRRWMAETV